MGGNRLSEFEAQNDTAFVVHIQCGIDMDPNRCEHARGKLIDLYLNFLLKLIRARPFKGNPLSKRS